MKQVRKYIQRAEEKRLSSTHFIMFNFTWIYEFQLRISIMNFKFLWWDICDEWTRGRVGIRQAKESPRGKGREMTRSIRNNGRMLVTANQGVHLFVS